MNFKSEIMTLSLRQVAACGDLAGAMRPPLRSPGRLQFALMLTLIEQFEAAVLLAEAGLVTHGAVHARSMLMALADLRLLRISAEHTQRMKHDQASSEVRLYKRGLAAAVHEKDRVFFERRLSDSEASLEPLKEVVRPRKLEETEKLRQADLVEMIVPYTMLCGFVHNDLAALSLRHQGQESMTLRAPAADHIFWLVLQVAHAALMLGAEEMSDVAAFDEEAFHQAISRMRVVCHRISSLVPPRPDGA
ncbi:hypothetical protein [Xanthomonas sp. 60]